MVAKLPAPGRPRAEARMRRLRSTTRTALDVTPRVDLPDRPVLDHRSIASQNDLIAQSLAEAPFAAHPCIRV